MQSTRCRAWLRVPEHMSSVTILLRVVAGWRVLGKQHRNQSCYSTCQQGFSYNTPICQCRRQSPILNSGFVEAAALSSGWIVCQWFDRRDQCGCQHPARHNITYSIAAIGLSAGPEAKRIGHHQFDHQPVTSRIYLTGMRHSFQSNAVIKRWVCCRRNVYVNNRT